MTHAFSSTRVDNWPVQDRSLWAAARREGGYWDDGGLAAHWRPATVATAEYHYGTFLWWLRREGRLDPDASPADRATPENVRDFIAGYSAGHAPKSVADVVQVIADMVRVTAQSPDVQWIRSLARRISRQATPVKPPSHRTRPAMELVEIAITLMERGEGSLKERPRRGAIHFRDGLMVLAETCLPLRRKNYAGLCLGRTLFREDERYRVSFLAGEMKNSRDWEGWYPEWLTDRLDLYIRQVRPIFRAGLNEPDEGWLWLGYQGQPMKIDCVSLRVRQIVEKATGVPLSLHSFRHSVTTDIAIHDPKHVGIVKSLLGHTSPLSARHYDLATNIEASIRYQNLMSQLIQEDLEGSG